VKLALSLSSTLYGEGSPQAVEFDETLGSSLGNLFEEGEIDTLNVPMIPVVMNSLSQTFGSSFPSFANLGGDGVSLLCELFREKLCKNFGQFRAVRGMIKMVGTMQPREAALWLCMFSLGLAYLDMCKLAADA
jgi:hypothetical protein